MKLPFFNRSEQGPNYRKRLLDPSKLTMGAVVRWYCRGYDKVWRYEDIQITRNGVFTRALTRDGSLWTSGRELGEERQQYYSLYDMGIVPNGDGAYNPRAYTILLKSGRKK